VNGGRVGGPLRGRTLVGGRAAGLAIVLEEPLSFWGGMDPETGRLTDPHHPQRGVELGASILLMPSGRGSSSSSSVLVEAVRLGTSPAAIVLLTADPIVALGSIVAGELYGRALPVLVLEATDYGSIRAGDGVHVETRGRVAIVRVAPGASMDQS
jgi:predicted aconitase with swiveling domain